MVQQKTIGDFHVHTRVYMYFFKSVIFFLRHEKTLDGHLYHPGHKMRSERRKTANSGYSFNVAV